MPMKAFQIANVALLSRREAYQRACEYAKIHNKVSIDAVEKCSENGRNFLFVTNCARRDGNTRNGASRWLFRTVHS